MSMFRIDENELCRIIADAPKYIIRIAKKKEIPTQKSFIKLKGQWRHRRLSQSWVKYLGRSLEKFYQENYSKNIFAFPSQFDLKKKLRIKQREFLFDVSVGLYESFESNRFECSKKVLPIYYQSHSIWQIESEFAENTREIAVDFSKLLAGNADYAMMVGPSGREKTNYYMNEMKKILRSIDKLRTRYLYFLILPHPHNWTDEDCNWKDENDWNLYRWNKDDWDEVDDGKWNFKTK